METVGHKLRQARLAKNLEIDEVAEATKIRPDRIVDLEADDYAEFPNLAYAKSFLIIYAKYLQIDIREELESFQITRTISLGEYQYLVSAPPPRGFLDSRRFQPRGFRVPPLVVTVLVLILLVGVPVISYLAVNVSRLKAGSPSLAANDELEKKSSDLVEAPNSSRSDASSEAVTSLRPGALVSNSTTPSSPVEVARLNGSAPFATRGSEDAETEIRRAQPVVPILPTTEKAPRPDPVPTDFTPKPDITPVPDKKLEVHALRKTWVKVTRNEEGALPVYEGYAGPEKLITVVGKRFWIRVKDKSAVEVRKDGQLVLSSSDDMVFN